MQARIGHRHEHTLSPHSKKIIRPIQTTLFSDIDQSQGVLTINTGPTDWPRKGIGAPRMRADGHPIRMEKAIQQIDAKRMTVLLLARPISAMLAPWPATHYRRSTLRRMHDIPAPARDSVPDASNGGSRRRWHSYRWPPGRTQVPFICWGPTPGPVSAGAAGG
jgi:hypothetical protein